jgi:hypothetical protein
MASKNSTHDDFSGTQDTGMQIYLFIFCFLSLKKKDRREGREEKSSKESENEGIGPARCKKEQSSFVRRRFFFSSFG